MNNEEISAEQIRALMKLYGFTYEKACSFTQEEITKLFENRQSGANSGVDKFTLERPKEGIANFLGDEFAGLKGQQAVNKLLQEKRGHIKGAFRREDIGDVDLVWGNDDIGLQHIIKRRTSEGLPLKDFMSELTDVIETGEIKKSPRGNYEIIKNKHVAVIQPEFKGNKFNFVVTAYRTRKDSW